jgi:serine protease AprX
LTGNANQGANNRGVTQIQVDSFKDTASDGGVFGEALMRAYSAAVAGGDKIINNSQQRWEDENSTIAAAADTAFDDGSAVFAAQGNQGPATLQTRCPGNARKAFAVGAIDVTTQIIENGSSRGPSNDGRHKPDAVGPTNVRTASRTNDTAFTAIFNGTSAATPHIAGLAALWRNWALGSMPVIDPGQLYSMLLAFGNHTGNNSIGDSTTGAGLVVAPTSATWFANRETLTAGQTKDIPLNITGTISSIEAAIWWPETSAQHNDVDLYLIAPDGSQKAYSIWTYTVWEKVRYATTTVGTWKLRVKNRGTAAQTVYSALLQRF